MSKKLIQAAAGAAGGEPVYVEDVFSTYLYEGTGSSLSIDNGIDLDGEGGLVWIKERTDTGQHHFYDTERGATKRIHSNSTAAEATQSDALTAFNSNGFTLGTNSQVNDSGEDTCSWSFRKQAGFFDVVTYTGNGDSSLGAGDGSTQTISHNLGSAPGLIIVKDTGNSSDWIVYHRSLGSTHYIKLNTTGAGVDFDGYWNDTDPTSTEFTVGTHYYANGSGNNFVAYLFAHDDQSFGDDSDESIIKCGSYSGNGLTTGNEITLGFEPQWLMVKRTDSTNNWMMMDIMRGITDSSNNYLLANTSAAEAATGSAVAPTATGFNILTDTSSLNNSSGTYIYIAIRRPMKTPEAGTEVFAIDTRGSSSGEPNWKSGFVTDWAFITDVSQAANRLTSARLIQGKNLNLDDTGAESANSNYAFDYMNGFFSSTSVNSNFYGWLFKRATGFFDVICHSGSGYNTNVKHNLGVVPELVISKTRSASGFGTDLDKWYVWSSAVSGSGNNAFGFLNETGTTTNSFFASSPTSTDLYLHGNVAYSGDSLVKYLFATVAGVSKVGSYTGTGSSQTIDCGFSSGARFVLIKRTDSSGNWLVFDTVRGITVGNTDGVLTLDTTTQEYSESAFFSNDVIQPDSSGFKVLSSASLINDSGGEYIFLAIA